jgi:hypothetical protein
MARMPRGDLVQEARLLEARHPAPRLLRRARGLRRGGDVGRLARGGRGPSTSSVAGFSTAMVPPSAAAQ